MLVTDRYRAQERLVTADTLEECLHVGKIVILYLILMLKRKDERACTCTRHILFYAQERR